MLLNTVLVIERSFKITLSKCIQFAKHNLNWFQIHKTIDIYAFENDKLLSWTPTAVVFMLFLDIFSSLLFSFDLYTEFKTSFRLKSETSFAKQILPNLKFYSFHAIIQYT